MQVKKKTHSFQSRICESPCPPPGFPEPLVRKRWVQDRKSSWTWKKRKQDEPVTKLHSFSLTESICCFSLYTQLYSRVGIEISIVDCFNQLLRNLDDLLFTSCRQNKRQKEANRWQLVRCQLEGETITVWWVSAQWHFVSSLQLLPSFTRSSSVATAQVPSLTWSPGSKSCLVTGARPPSLSLAQLLAFATTQQLTEHDSPLWAHTANQTEATTLLVEITAFLTRGPLSFLLLWPTVRGTSEQTCQTLMVLFPQLFHELINSNSLINFNPFPL